MADTALISGGVLHRATYGGHVWAFAQYVRGLRSLGWRVVFIDRFDDPFRPDHHSVLEFLGGPGDIAVLDRDGNSRWGLTREQLVGVARRADVLLNVMGYLDDPEILAGPRRRLFLDIDPGFGQMWRAEGLADIFAGHDVHATVGLTLPGSSVPDLGIEWVTTLPPVHLPDWPETPVPDAGAVTSVSSWRGPFGPVQHDGESYGLRVHEFRRFLELPAMVEERLEVALDIDPADEGDRRSLVQHGWHLVDPRTVAGTPARYRDYVRGSKAELLVAKHMYVASGGGWFSDRSACYLACGRPVVAQETGFSRVLPVGSGLLAFTDLASAAAALTEMGRNYRAHAEAARTMARERFSSDVVLPALLQAAL